MHFNSINYDHFKHFFDTPWDGVVNPWDALEVIESSFLPSVQLQTQEEVDALISQGCFLSPADDENPAFFYKKDGNS